MTDSAMEAMDEAFEASISSPKAVADVVKPGREEEEGRKGKTLILRCLNCNAICSARA